MRIADSRRLTGPNLLLDGPGAQLDIALHGLDPATVIAAWRAELERLLAALGWGGAAIASRPHQQGVSLAFGAPIDALYAATEVNEAAWHAAVVQLGGGSEAGEGHGHGHADTLADAESDGDDDAPPFDAVVARLRAQVDAERNPALIALAAAAAQR